MSTENETKKTRHWGTMFLGAIVAALFLIIIFSFQVKTTECAVVSTLGRLSTVDSPGWHWRWPYPIQSIHKFDNRVRCFEGSAGKLEETLTKNGQNIIIGSYVNYKINDPKAFYKQMVSVISAEGYLTDWLRSANKAIIGRYNFDQFVNTDPNKMMLDKMEIEIKELLEDKCKSRGMEIITVGINCIEVPKSNTKEVFNRMIAERKTVSSGFRSKGKREAQKIRTEADQEKMNILTEAQAQAKGIRAEGDAEAAKYYAKFKENPELAIFLRKLDSLKKVMGKKTTLILDTDSAPFDILKMGSEKLDSNKKTGK